MTNENESKENTSPKESKFWRFLKALIPSRPMGREAWAYFEYHPGLRDQLSSDDRLASIRAELSGRGVIRGCF